MTFFKIPTVSVGVDHVISGRGVVVVLVDVVARERVVVGLQVSVVEDQDQYKDYFGIFSVLKMIQE